MISVTIIFLFIVFIILFHYQYLDTIQSVTRPYYFYPSNQIEKYFFENPIYQKGNFDCAKACLHNVSNLYKLSVDIYSSILFPKSKKDMIRHLSQFPFIKIKEITTSDIQNSLKKLEIVLINYPRIPEYSLLFGHWSIIFKVTDNTCWLFYLN